MFYEKENTKNISFPLGGIGTGSVGLAGNGSFKALLPLLPTLLKSFNNFNNGKNYNSEETSSYYEEAQNLTPIKDIANEKIMSTLGNYFNT